MRLVIATMLLCLNTCATAPAVARDNGQWEDSDPAIGAWFARQHQPDNPRVSCCGEADAYEADRVQVRDGKFFAVITDERDDAKLRRPHIDVGTLIEIPPPKFKDPRADPNPTGHGIVFIGSSGQVFCYFNPDGQG